MPYPDGFNGNNCIVISEMYQRGNTYFSSKDYAGFVLFNVSTYPDNVVVEYTWSNTIFCNKPFKISLMRTDI